MQNAHLTETFYGLPEPSRLRRVARSLTPRPGIRREPALSRQLAELVGEGYRVFRNGDIGPDPMDQIVVGPTGVFLIRLNRWGGRFSVRPDGWFRHSRKDAGALVWEVTRETMAVKARLAGNGTAPEVQGIVAVSRSKMQDPVIQMAWVTFVAAPDVVRYLSSRRSALSAEQVDLVAAHIAA